MGMYDTIYIKVKCPKCKGLSLTACQTKDLDCELNEYFVGDFALSNKLLTEITVKEAIHCIAECVSDECIKNTKTISGAEYSRGHYFKIFIILRGGIITGEYIDIYEA